MAEDDDEYPPIKVVVVGDGAVGKTCLLTVFASGKFPTQYVPTVFENTSKDHTFNLDGETTAVTIDIWDTAGQEDLDRLRPLSYRDAQIFLICFSLVNPASFENIEFKWLPEIEHHRRKNNNVTESGHDAQIVLCGTKCDLKNDSSTIARLSEEDKKPISQEQIDEFINNKMLPKVAKCQSTVPYIECSALKMKNVNEPFEAGVQLFLKSLEDDNEGGAGGTGSSGGGCCILL